MQSSVMLGLLAVAIFVGQWIDSPPLAPLVVVLFWAGTLVILMWVALLALADIVVLDVTLVLLIVRFWRASRPAGALLIPYLLWVLFATYLNIGIFSLN